MTGAGDLIDETGTLVRDGGGFALRRDGGGIVRLELARVPVDHVEKHVRIMGRRIDGDRVEVAGVSATERSG